MASSSNTTVFGGTIHKSSYDKCQYRLLTLSNNLQALLVHEPDLDKASAALDVHVGLFQDPTDIPGLAHFLEHLLFMGTEKYPKENDYSQFLAEHGGSSNAFTAEEHTNYFFDVSSEYLEPALDRFAQFFIKPLFAESGTEREMNAVHSEHQKNVRNDNWRIDQLERWLANPAHPYHKFGTGNLQTLRDAPKQANIDIRRVLIDFHSEKYSANIMKLVVYGCQPLDQLAQWVEEKFTAIPNKSLPVSVSSPDTWTDDQRQKSIVVKSLKEMRTLHITWQISDQQKAFLTKPESYYSHLIGHEGTGSILSLLKKRGWAITLGASCETESKGFAFFKVAIELSVDGLAHQEEIIYIVFAYLNILRRDGPQEWIFSETKKIDNFNFDFMEKGQPIDWTYRLAGWMQRYPPEHIIDGTFIIEKYDAKLIADMLCSLNTHNFRVMLAWSDATPPANGTFQVEPWYQTEYTVTPLSPEFIKSLEKAELPSSELHLPVPNPFIPDSFDLKPQPEARVKPAKLSIQDTTVWFKQDDTFRLPKGNAYFLLRSPNAYSSPITSVRVHLFLELVMDSLTEESYAAELAGLKYNLQLLAEGVELQVSGFNQKMHLLLEKVADRMANLVIDPARFDIIKEQYMRSLRNAKEEPPYWHASYHASELLQERFWRYDDKLKVLPLVTVHDVAAAGLAVISNCKVDCLIHGNLDEADAELLVAKFTKSVKPCMPANAVPQLHSAEVQPPRSVCLPDGASFVYCPELLPNPNNAVEVYFQTGTTSSMRDRVLTALFVQIFSEPFFDTLRTNEQFGYIVTHQQRERSLACGLRFLIQSEKDPNTVEDRIEAFLANVPQHIVALTREEVRMHVTALIHLLVAKKKKLSQESKAYWGQIVPTTNDFGRTRDDAACLSSFVGEEPGKGGAGIEQIRKELLSFFNERVALGAKHRRKLAVHVRSDSLVAQSSEDGKDEKKKSNGDCTAVAMHDEKDLAHFKRTSTLFAVAPSTITGWACPPTASSTYELP